MSPISRSLLLSLVGILLLLGPRLQAQPFGVSVEVSSYSPNLIPSDETSIITLNCRTTGAGSFFWMLIDSAPSGWNAVSLSTEERFIDGSRNFQFNMSVEPIIRGTDTITVGIYGRDLFNNPVLLLTYDVTLTVADGPGSFQVIEPSRNAVLDGPFRISWSPAQSADFYEVSVAEYVGGQPQYPALLFFGNQTTREINLDTSQLSPGGRYEIAVAAVNEIGFTLNDGGPVVFTVAEDPPPGRFNLLEPVRDAITGGNPSFRWSPSENAASYTVNLFREENGSPNVNPVRIAPVTGTTYDWQDPPLDRGQFYYASVTAISAGGERVNDEGLVRFYVQTLEDFALVSPLPGQTGVPLRPEFRWQVSGGATAYLFTLFEGPVAESGSELYQTGVLQNEGFIQLELPPDITLEPATVYTWSVVALLEDGPGNVVEFRGSLSGEISFTTTALTPFSLLFPEPDAFGVDPVPTFGWESAGGATSYRVQLTTPNAEDAPNPLGILTSPDIFNTVWTWAGSPLEKGRDYFWRVEATDGINTNLNTDDWRRFRVQSLEPFDLTSPEDGAEDVEVQPVLRWQAAPNAESYRVYLYIQDLFIAPIFEVPGNRTSLDLVDADYILSSRVVYTWTVEAVRDGESVLATEQRTFRTGIRDDNQPDEAVDSRFVLDHLLGRNWMGDLDRLTTGIPSNEPIDAAYYKQLRDFEDLLAGVR